MLGTILMVLFFNGFYCREYDTPKTAFEQAGYTVELASTQIGYATPQPSSGCTYTPYVGKLVTEVDPSQYVAVVFIGGTLNAMTVEYISNVSAFQAVQDISAYMVSNNKPVGYLCHGMGPAAMADVFRGIVIASAVSDIRCMMTAGGATMSSLYVVITGNIVTGRSNTQSLEFANALLSII